MFCCRKLQVNQFLPFLEECCWSSYQVRLERMTVTEFLQTSVLMDLLERKRFAPNCLDRLNAKRCLGCPCVYNREAQSPEASCLPLTCFMSSSTDLHGCLCAVGHSMFSKVTTKPRLTHGLPHVGESVFFSTAESAGLYAPPFNTRWCERCIQLRVFVFAGMLLHMCNSLVEISFDVPHFFILTLSLLVASKNVRFSTPSIWPTLMSVEWGCRAQRWSLCTHCHGTHSKLIQLSTKTRDPKLITVRFLTRNFINIYYQKCFLLSLNCTSAGKTEMSKTNVNRRSGRPKKRM